MRRLRGFTLVEALCVIAILMALATLLLPAFSASKLSAKATSTIGNLKQLHLAVKLYQIEYDGDGVYGAPARMGLIDMQKFYRGGYRLYSNQDTLWNRPCGEHEGIPYRPALAYYPMNDPDGPWEPYVNEVRDSAVLFVDANCNDASVRIDSPFFAKRVVAIRLGGWAKSYTLKSDLVDFAAIWR